MDGTQAKNWDSWVANTDAAFHHCMDLMWMRHMWKTTDQILVASDAPGSGTIQNHLTSTYVFAICTLIRRETDLSLHTSSLARQLVILRDTGGLITRSTFTGSDSNFEVFAPSGSQVVDPAIIERDINLLRAAAKPVKLYTDKIIAHRERFGPNAPVLELQFSEIDHALAVIGDTITRYWMLVHPGNHLARTTPVDDRGWFQAFTVPWIKSGQTFVDVTPPI